MSSKHARRSHGQSITEYGAVIAFVGVLICMAFMIRGALFPPISQSYSATGSALDRMNTEALKAGP